MDTEINNYTKILLEFQKIPKLTRTRTFLEISGYPHYENVCSNILQFFLNPNNEHGLKDLVLNSLVQLADKDFKFDCDFEEIEVEREKRTLLFNRLDILITTDNYVIGIENKIFHFLNNDLADYSKTIASLCEQPNIKAINIILSLNKLSNQQDIQKANESNFITITYEDLFKSIRKNVGEYLSQSNPKYFIYLTDFMKSIQNLKPSTMENRILWNFLKENSEVVQELTDKYSEYKKMVFAKVDKLKEFLPRDKFAPLAFNQWIWNGSDENYDGYALVHDYKILNFEISVNACIDIKGWTIEVFGRNVVSTEYLFDHMCTDTNFLLKPLDQFETTKRLIIQRFDTETELEQVTETLKNLLTRIENHKKLAEEKK